METAVHFTTTPCKPYKDHRVQGKSYFAIFVLANDLCLLRLKVVELFCTFVRASLKFSCAKNYGSRAVAIFFSGGGLSLRMAETFKVTDQFDCS